MVDRSRLVASIVLVACGPIVSQRDAAGTDDTTGATSASGPTVPTGGASQVDGDPPPTDEGPLDEGPLDEGPLDEGPTDEGTTGEVPCVDPPAPGVVVHALGNLGTRVADVLVADVTNDGRAEILMTNPELGVVHLLDGTAPLDLAALTVVPTDGPAFAIAVADVDADDFADLVVAHADGRVEIRLADGSGAFVSGAMQTAAEELHNVEVGDLDGDGSIDVFVLGHIDGEGRVWWLRGGGDGTLAAPENLLGDDWPHAYSVGLGAIADAGRPGAHAAVAQTYDNDEHWVALLRPNAAPEIVGEMPHSATGLAVGHFDADGVADIAALGTETSEIFRWSGLAAGGFADMTTDGAYRGIGTCLAGGDVDGNGTTDMIAGYALAPSLERVRVMCDGSLEREWLGVDLGTELLQVIAIGDLDDDDAGDVVVVDGAFGGQDVTVLLTGDR